MEQKTINIIIIIIFAIMFIGLIVSIALGSDAYIKSQREKARKLECEWGHDNFCYKEDLSGDLVRYNMKKLNGELKLVRE